MEQIGITPGIYLSDVQRYEGGIFSKRADNMLESSEEQRTIQDLPFSLGNI